MTLTRGEFINGYLPQLGEMLKSRRWFAGKSRSVSRIGLKDWGVINTEAPVYLPFLRVEYGEGGEDHYFYPVTITGRGSMEDATGSGDFIQAMVSLISRESSLALDTGSLEGWAEPGAGRSVKVRSLRVVPGEQSNTSTVIDGAYVFKTIRRMTPGKNPDYEVPQYLASHGFKWTPGVMGKIQYSCGGNLYHVETLSRFMPGSRDAWEHFLTPVEDALAGHVERLEDLTESFARLGRVTSEMHNTLSLGTDNADFMPEPISQDDRVMLLSSYRELMARVVSEVSKAAFNGTVQPRSAGFIAGSRERMMQIAEEASGHFSDDLFKTRIHGDYHLGQVLWKDGSFYVIDFEGEPMRPMDYRRRKFPPLKDVAGMMRSIDYLVEMAGRKSIHRESIREEKNILRKRLSSSFMESYIENYNPGNQYLPDPGRKFDETLLFFEMEKVLYEIEYEVGNRPGYADIPVNSLVGYLQSPDGDKQN